MASSVTVTSVMRSAAVVGEQQLKFVTSPIPSCGPDEVLIRVAYCGICGSDVPRYFDGAVHAYPQVLGHELSGTVAAVGNDVTQVAVGDRVAVAPLVPCHACEECLAGHHSLCPRYSFVGSRQQGGLADYVVVPQVNAVPVGDLDLKLAALIEPLTVAIHGVERAEFEPGQDAAVLGGGVIGLMTVITLRDKGARHITVVDLNPWVLEVARRFGATHTVQVGVQDPTTHFRQLGAPALTIETAGAAATRQLALDVAAKNGTVVFVGTPTTAVTLDPDTFEHILRKELTLRGSWMSYSAPFPGGEWRQAPRLLATAASDPAAIVTHEFALADVAEGFAVMRSGEQQRLKVMFRIAGG